MIKSTKFVITMAMIFSLSVFAQPRIDLSEGTLSLHGGLSVLYDMRGFDTPQHQLGVASDLGGGYFVLDNWLVGLSIPAQWNFVPASGGEIGLKIYSDYFFNTDSVVFPYVGLSTTPGYSMNEKKFNLRAGLDLGILVSLSESVALDFGIKPELYFKLIEGQTWRISVPAGFLGVRAVF